MFMPDQSDCGSGAPLDWVQGQSDDCTTRTEGKFAGGAGLHGPGLSPPCCGLLFTGVSAKAEAEAEHEDSTGYDVNELV